MESWYIVVLLSISVVAFTFICLFVWISKECGKLEESLKMAEQKYELHITISTIEYEKYRFESLTKQIELVESNNELMRKLLDS